MNIFATSLLIEYQIPDSFDITSPEFLPAVKSRLFILFPKLKDYIIFVSPNREILYVWVRQSTYLRFKKKDRFNLLFPEAFFQAKNISKCPYLTVIQLYIDCFEKKSPCLTNLSLEKIPMDKEPI